jgi:hypothetical protein
MPNRPRKLLATVLVPTLFLTGCGNSLDQNKSERLKVGMSPQEVEAILGKGGKEISADELASLMRDALTPKAGPDVKGSSKLPKLELPDLSGARGFRWGDEKKSVTVVYIGDRVNRIFKKGL